MQPTLPRHKRFRPWRWLVLIVLLGAGIYYWMHHKPADKTPKRSDAPVVLTSVTRRDVPHYLTGLGTIQATNTVTVRTQVDGQLMAIKFREGQNVKAGDVLAQIDPRTYQAAYSQAVAAKAKNEAALANAQLDVKRYKKLGDSVARQTLDTQVSTVKELTAQLAADQAAIDSARTQLSYTTITAPISGRTGLRQIDVGNVVHQGDTNGLVVITQLQPIAMTFSLPQQNLQALNEQLATQPTLPVDALASDNSRVIDAGSLLLIDNQIDQTTGTIKLKASFPNKNAVLWPGAFVNARLLLSVQANALVIPTVAVQQGPQGSFVFLYQTDNTVLMRPVTVAMVQGTDSIISKGLVEGDQVVIDGMAKLQDKSKVTVAKPAEKTVSDATSEGLGKTEAATESADSVIVKPPSQKHHRKAQGG